MVQALTRRGRPSIYDVAELAGVSHQTVSRVINGHASVREKTRAKVLDAMAKINYTPSSAARALASNRTQRIGVIVGSPTYYGPSSTLWGIEDAARAVGYTVAAISASFDQDSPFTKTYDQLKAQGIDALCVIAPQYSHADLRDVDIPVVLIEAEPETEFLTVAVDQYAGALMAVDHLLELGHRRILHIAGSQDWGDGRIRARAYSDRMAEAGLDVPPIILGDWQADFGYEVGIDAATLGDATAVFVSNDQMALGLLHGLHSRGICVPDDLSIVGFDDIPEAKHFIPPLTTVRQDFHKLGRRAVRRLIDRLEGAEPTPNEMIAPKFTLRESTAPLR